MPQDYRNIREHLITYSPAADQTVYTHAHGVRYVDEQGKEYINMNDISCILGYDHPRFTSELARLVTTRMLGHPGMLSPEKEQLVANFMQVTHGDFDKLLITGSGGETVDWAVKAARRVTGRDGIVSFRNALHGRSFAGAFLSDIPFRKADFGTGLQHVAFWDYPRDGRALEPTADICQDIAGVIIEPYQAAGGMASPTKEYWQWLRRWTREHGVVLILDEIQTGFCKTGSFFAYQEAGIVPDILLAGKGMSNGFGLGAMLMSREVGAAIRPHEMSGGSADNDLMCAIVNLIFDIIRRDDLPAHVREVGRLLRSGLANVLAGRGVTGDFWGEGLFFSLGLPAGMAARIIPGALARGVKLGRSGDRLVFRPPLVLTEDDAALVVRAVSEVLADC